MPSYTTRVELHAASSQQDYNNLHVAMERRGFSRLILSGQGVLYHLPSAEYNYEGPSTIEQVLDSASGAAAETGRQHAVLVTEAVRRSWKNLPAAR